MKHRLEATIAGAMVLTALAAGAIFTGGVNRKGANANPAASSGNLVKRFAERPLCGPKGPNPEIADLYRSDAIEARSHSTSTFDSEAATKRRTQVRSLYTKRLQLSAWDNYSCGSILAHSDSVGDLRVAIEFLETSAKQGDARGEFVSQRLRERLALTAESALKGSEPAPAAVHPSKNVRPLPVLD